MIRRALAILVAASARAFRDYLNEEALECDIKEILYYQLALEMELTEAPESTEARHALLDKWVQLHVTHPMTWAQRCLFLGAKFVGKFHVSRLIMIERSFLLCFPSSFPPSLPPSLLPAQAADDGVFFSLFQPRSFSLTLASTLSLWLSHSLS
jgi:hypothetical protein